MSESIIEDIDSALNILRPPLAPTRCLIYGRQDGGRKEEQGRNEVDEWSTAMVEKWEKTKEGEGERISQDIPVPSCEKRIQTFYCFQASVNCFVVFTPKEEETWKDFHSQDNLSLLSPINNFIQFQSLQVVWTKDALIAFKEHGMGLNCVIGVINPSVSQV